ncbi:MFS transporter [Brevibacterium marinum]|uniref:MFS family permease n=1 Tax=Brevibacterium marinum TaxID=418643 RepID=A0A846SBZ2_9MICO|nr:MFS transporter [Brevibacterium marinum]NJC58267.1 MFS family permease [Brevibacterium marinum]
MRAQLPRAFRWFWAGETVSGFGSWITLLALQVIVVDYLHAGTVGLGWMNAARWLPYLLFGLVLGALIDRVRRRPVMIASDLVRALLLSAIPVLWIGDLLNLVTLLLLAALLGTATLVNDSASQAFVPRLIPSRSLQSAHARIDGTNAAAETAGPALGGALLAVIAAPLAMLVNVGTFLFSAVVVSALRVEEPARARVDDSARPSLRREIGAGLKWVYSTPSLRDLAVWTHVWFAAQAVFVAVTADYFLNDIGIDAFWFGIVMAGSGFGGIIGALSSRGAGEKLGNGRAVILAHVCSASGALVLLAAPAIAGPVPVLFLGVFLHGFGIGLSNSHEMAYRQSITPDGFQARTNTTMRSTNRAVVVIVSPLAGSLAAATSSELALTIAAGIFALAAAGLWFSPFRTVRIDT